MRARLQSRWSPAQEPAVVASSPDRSTGVWDQSVDLVVLGTGAAGLSAARTWWTTKASYPIRGHSPRAGTRAV